MTRIVHCETWWDSCDWSYRAAESVQRELSCMAGFAQREPFRGGEIVRQHPSSAENPLSGSHRVRQDLAQLKPSGRGLGVHGLLKGCICPAEAAREGWQDLHDSRHRVR